jgi:DNA mismatch endonuclease (patch repair protein)
VTDFLSPEQRSRVMSRIRGRDTTPERYICELLRASGLVFSQHDRSLPGCPDFVFPKAGIAVFINGDFFHGWRFPIWKHRVPAFWQEKIAGNRSRDERNLRKLRRAGWRVVRIWEHQVEEDAEACLAKIADAVCGGRINWRRVKAAKAALPPLKRRNRLPKP